MSAADPPERGGETEPESERAPASAPQAPRSKAATVLLPRFLARRRQDAVTLRAAVEQGAFETVARLGHNMRGNGRSYGFPELGVIGDRLESAAESRDVPVVLEQLAAFDAWLERTSELDDVEQRPKSTMRVRATTATTESEAVRRKVER